MIKETSGTANTDKSRKHAKKGIEYSNGHVVLFEFTCTECGNISRSVSKHRRICSPCSIARYKKTEPDTEPDAEPDTEF
jgi:hypothetical protein